MESAETNRPPSLRKRIMNRMSNQKPRLTKAAIRIERYAEPCKNCVETAFFLLAITWALYVFVYTDWYKPSIERPQVMSSAQLENVGRKEKTIVLKATVKVKNNGKVKSKVIAAYYNILGYQVQPQQETVSGQQYPKAAMDDLANAQKHDWEMHMARYYQKTGSKVLQSGQFLMDSWLEPGEEYERAFNVYVPEEFDMASLLLNAWAIRDAPFIRWREAEEKVKVKWEINQDNGLLFPIISINNCTFCFNENWEALDSKQESHKKFTENQGVIQNDASVEVSFWPDDKK